VVADFSFKKEINHNSFTSIGYNYSTKLDKWNISDLACDYVFVGNSELSFDVPGTIGIIYSYNKWLSHQKGYPLISVYDYLEGGVLSKKLNFLQLCLDDLSEEVIAKLKISSNIIIVMSTNHINSRAEQRRLFIELINNKINNPVIIHRHYHSLSQELLQMHTSIEIGSLLLDGLGDGVFISAEKCCTDSEVNKIAFNILQGARIRISKTEYISCPSCGRTQFDLEKTTQKIREKTTHLKGLKIGIMGCIVNGPGEMADADYGYVGTGYNKVSLYKQQTLVKKNIHTKDALNELIQLIKDNDDWVDVS